MSPVWINIDYRTSQYMEEYKAKETETEEQLVGCNTNES